MNRDKVMTFLKKSLRFLPDKSYIKLYYRLRVGRKLNMDNPTTLNEKLQWMKFNYRFPLQSIVSDKLLVRDYVKEKIGEEYLIPLLGSWKDYEDIDFSLLPKQFVLKCNHDSGGLVVCTDKDKVISFISVGNINIEILNQGLYVKSLFLIMETFLWIIRYIALTESQTLLWFVKTVLVKIHIEHHICIMIKSGILFH